MSKRQRKINRRAYKVKTERSPSAPSVVVYTAEFEEPKRTREEFERTNDKPWHELFQPKHGHRQQEAASLETRIDETIIHPPASREKQLKNIREDRI